MAVHRCKLAVAFFLCSLLASLEGRPVVEYMIAQEVEKVFPDWVETAPNGMKRLSIHGFEALTVEALRDS